ncbi:5-formyltetrahydrofolate cyclo-ligase [Muriicola soli]|uniref:5-formyltetrahydrofolate cyclo-ligase n=1 Tax=Muriicola soli TaxID=2507538 RepID=A0A411ECT1_9FLAO|nr:5-formyltetrahydrofolate cyclo-ligase [Muriicola soli]QBA65200.1 5-formyltetrahydrofolate cyclo-ligase [Muriicola soli]
MLKKDLRTHFLELRKNTSDAIIEEASLVLANSLLAMPIWGHTYYHIFLHSAFKKEIDTGPIITLLRGKDKEIIIPKIAPQNQLQHFLLTDSTTLKPNNWGIPEPEHGIKVSPSEIEVVFVPLLAFDRKGHRVGYGGGYYDSFLSECNENTEKIGLSLFDPVDVISDSKPHDIPLDYCVTPEKIYTF